MTSVSRRLSAKAAMRVGLVHILGHGQSFDLKYKTAEVTPKLLTALLKLWVELRQFFNLDHDMVNNWICHHFPALDGAPPLELMGSQEGRCIIREHLAIMRYGNFA